MASKLGRIAPIKREYASNNTNLEAALAKHEFYASFPGTRKIFFPYKEANGKYRTGLDVDADYIRKMPEAERKVEIARIKETKARLEKDLDLASVGLDLGPRSSVYNYASNNAEGQKVTPIGLSNSEEIFDLSEPFKELQWNWIKVHPQIAPSLEAVYRGQADPKSQYYVLDVELEEKVVYNRKKDINKAIATLEDLTPVKLRQVARLMGLPVTETDDEETVYNQLDNILKQTDLKFGKLKGASPVRVFNEIVSLSPALIVVKDLITQAITFNIYRVKEDGSVYEGSVKVADGEDELAAKLIDKKHLEELTALKQKLKIKNVEID